MNYNADELGHVQTHARPAQEERAHDERRLHYYEMYANEPVVLVVEPLRSVEGDVRESALLNRVVDLPRIKPAIAVLVTLQGTHHTKPNGGANPRDNAYHPERLLHAQEELVKRGIFVEVWNESDQEQFPMTNKRVQDVPMVPLPSTSNTRIILMPFSIPSTTPPTATLASSLAEIDPLLSRSMLLQNTANDA